MNNIELKHFDMAEQLRNEEDIAAYLSMVLEKGDTEELIAALGIELKIAQ
ncbi:DNA-binding protein [Marinomonas gallaica]